MTEKLFVYGTLCPGQPNEHLLTKIGGTWQKASVKGVLHEEGWGATMGYPAIVLDNSGKEVPGYVFSSDNLAEHWSELDQFEGDAYERKLADVNLDNAASIRAHIYTLRNVPSS